MGRSGLDSSQRISDTQEGVDLTLGWLWDRGDSKVSYDPLVVGEHEGASHVREELVLDWATLNEWSGSPIWIFIGPISFQTAATCTN